MQTATWAVLVTFLVHARSLNARSVRGRTHGTLKEPAERPCSCDCCAVAFPNGKTECAPLASLALDTDEKPLVANCPLMCGLPAPSFFSRGSVVDASRFCLETCVPVEEVRNTQCISRGDRPERVAHPVTTEFVHHTTRHAMKNGDKVSLAEARSEMLQAMQEARRAGEAAKRAKIAYEMVRRSARDAAEAAGRATLKEIQREAGEQATKAKTIREKYEAVAKLNAQNAAIGLAKVYKDAMLKAQAVAGMWGLRAQEYARAATQRKGMSSELAKEAHDYMATKEIAEAQNYLLQAHQAMQQAEDFAREADDAHKTATKINDSIKWYSYAERAAAANVLAASMPPDVPPPEMPTLP
eukprot:GEMP01057166.1.p1 GENE.GEMP01057166.1~~GEMP01057166.1.p1  ORF type:complete len:355 (+),score=99.77 GEMP01057166.1:46-1110(+)